MIDQVRRIFHLPWKVHVKNKGTITYLYDASGNKLEKQTTEGGHTTRTDYIGGYIYRNDTLQQITQEEGRIRPKDSSYVYDYFIKDHLGNTRMVLTEENQKDIYPAATLESGSVSTEQTYYTINTGNIVSQPVSLTDNYPNNNGIPNPGNANAGSNSSVMYKLNAATGDKMGMGITLKVMSGDTVSILGRSYWHSNGSSVDNNYSIPVNDLLLALTNPGILITAKGYTYSLLEGLPVTPAALQGWLNNAPSNSSNPKAYINWILLDEQMKPVTGASGFDAVGATDELKLHAQTVNIPKNGYLYVYVSNQSDQDVFFDNLQVVHARGPLLEETHYYPFGLAMSGIGSKAAGKLANRYKYNGKELQSEEFNDGSGLELYDYGARMYDAQIGRWGVVDPMSEAARKWTPYAYAYNNPLLFVDPDGMMADFYDGQGTYLGNNGVDDNKVYQLKENVVANYNNKTVNWGGTLSEAHSKDIISKSDYVGAVQEIKLEFTGTANEKNPKQGDGKLDIIQVVSGGKEFKRASFDAVGGPWGNGSPENGTYTVSNLQDRGPKGWYNEGMTKEGVGYSLDVNPLFKTGRSLLRIHPDGGRFFGTQGCIGLECGKEGLMQFKELAGKGLSLNKSMSLIVNILNNPNNNGYGKKVKSNGE